MTKAAQGVQALLQVAGLMSNSVKLRVLSVKRMVCSECCWPQKKQKTKYNTGTRYNQKSFQCCKALYYYTIYRKNSDI